MGEHPGPEAGTQVGLSLAASLQALCCLDNSSPFQSPPTVLRTCSQPASLCSACLLPEEHRSAELIFLLSKEVQDFTHE